MVASARQAPRPADPPRSPARSPRKKPQTKRSAARSKKKAARSPLKRRLIFVAKWAALVGLVLVLVAVGGFIWAYRSIEVPEAGNAAFETQTSFVYYDGGEGEPGEPIGTFAVQNRDIIDYDEMPENIKDAVVAAENRSFWTDSGIDPKGILRAVLNNASSDTQQGASTITQQYVKLFYLTTERSYTRKVKEAIVSLKLVRQQTKEQILEGYLNTIYFGRGAYGIQTAAQTFFDKDAGELTVQRERDARQHHQQPHPVRPGQRQGRPAGAQGAVRLRARRDGRGRRHQRRGGRGGRGASCPSR